MSPLDVPEAIAPGTAVELPVGAIQIRYLRSQDTTEDQEIRMAPGAVTRDSIDIAIGAMSRCRGIPPVLYEDRVAEAAAREHRMFEVLCERAPPGLSSVRRLDDACIYRL